MITTEDRLTILVAEDDENDFILLRRALSRLATQEEVLRVSDGEQARAYLKRDTSYADRKLYPFPDLLILDQALPRMTGLEVLRWLRQQGRFDCLPVVVCSVFSPGQEAAVERLNAACCVKSGDIGQLHRTIAESMLCAFRMASLVPDVAWYRSMGFIRPSNSSHEPTGKSEIRNPKSTKNPKLEIRNPSPGAGSWSQFTRFPLEGFP